MDASDYRATSAGKLPEVPEPSLGSIRLPPGRLITPDTSFRAQPSTVESVPVLWISNSQLHSIGSIWRDIAQTFATHGLWPLVLEALDGDDLRPWMSGELDPTSSTNPDDHEVEAILASWWADVIPVEWEEPRAFEVIAPFDRDFPGLAPASQSLIIEAAFHSVTAELTGRLGLVAAKRPADVITTIGWMGPLNYYDDMGPLSAVLRSWEDRFGAFVVGIGFDTLTLAVQRPPDTTELATAIAVEHFAACPDIVTQGVGSIDAYADVLLGQEMWSLWWD